MNTFHMVTADEAAAQSLEPAAFLSIARWHERAAQSGDNPGLSRRIAAVARAVAFDLADRLGIDIRSRRQERKPKQATRPNNDNRRGRNGGHRNAKRRAA